MHWKLAKLSRKHKNWNKVSCFLVCATFQRNKASLNDTFNLNRRHVGFPLSSSFPQKNNNQG